MAPVNDALDENSTEELILDGKPYLICDYFRWVYQ